MELSEGCVLVHCEGEVGEAHPSEKRLHEQNILRIAPSIAPETLGSRGREG